jgi:hypothetical protein
MFPRILLNHLTLVNSGPFVLPFFEALPGRSAGRLASLVQPIKDLASRLSLDTGGVRDLRRGEPRYCSPAKPSEPPFVNQTLARRVPLHL